MVGIDLKTLKITVTRSSTFLNNPVNTPIATPATVPTVKPMDTLKRLALNCSQYLPVTIRDLNASITFLGDGIMAPFIQPLSVTTCQIVSSKIGDIIEGTYHDFKTDGSWIAGNTDQIVDYLLKVENDLLTTDARKAAEKERNAEFLRIVRIILEAFGVCCIIAFAIFHKRKVDELEELIEYKDSNIRRVKDDYSELMDKKDSIDDERKKLETWKERAIAADPDIEKKIKTLLAKRKAEKFSKDFGAAATLKDYVAMFEQYGSMTEEEKSYVTLDMGRAQDMLDELAKIEAKKATEMIEETCQLSTTSSHYFNYN